MSPLQRAIGMLALVPSIAIAQQRPLVEIGTRLGATVEDVSGQTTTYLGVPGAGILAQPTIYASFFATPNIMVEPEVAFNLITGSGTASTYTTVGAAGSIGYLTSTTSNGAPFLAATVGVQHASGGGSSHTEAAVGGTLGYRLAVEQSLAVRLQLSYLRWLGSSHINQITIGLGLGAIVHAAR